jgi:hypothetical protein
MSTLGRLALGAARRLMEFSVGTVVVFRHTRLVAVACEARVAVVPPQALADALGMDSEARVEMLQRCAGRGELVYGAYLGGRLMHRSCLQPGPGIARCEHRVTFPLRRDEAYIHNCRTHPAGRGRGMYPATLSRIARDWKSGGRELFVATVESNTASMRGIERAGFSMVRRVRSLVLFGVRVWHSDVDVPG